MSETILGYRWLRKIGGTVKCNLGCNHRSEVNEVVELTYAPDESFDVEYNDMGPTRVGKALVAYDADGNRYTKRPTWDGYDYWLRDDNNDLAYAPYPVRGDVTYDTHGNEI